MMISRIALAFRRLARQVVKGDAYPPKAVTPEGGYKVGGGGSGVAAPDVTKPSDAPSSPFRPVRAQSKLFT